MNIDTKKKTHAGSVLNGHQKDQLKLNACVHLRFIFSFRQPCDVSHGEAVSVWGLLYIREERGKIQSALVLSVTARENDHIELCAKQTLLVTTAYLLVQ